MATTMIGRRRPTRFKEIDMINPNNPNLARPETLFQGFAHFDIATHRFSGKKSFDGQVGGFPLLYDKEKRQLAVDAGDIVGINHIARR